MNKASTIAAVFGMALIALAGLFPPVVQKDMTADNARRGYLLSPSIYLKQMPSSLRKQDLDLARLAVEWITISAATGAACMALFRTRKDH